MAVRGGIGCRRPPGEMPVWAWCAAAALPGGRTRWPIQALETACGPVAAAAEHLVKRYVSWPTPASPARRLRAVVDALPGAPLARVPVR
jgi:hypothetical protein